MIQLTENTIEDDGNDIFLDAILNTMPIMHVRAEPHRDIMFLSKLNNINIVIEKSKQGTWKLSAR